MVFIPAANDTQIIKLRPRNANVVDENIVARFFLRYGNSVAFCNSAIYSTNWELQITAIIEETSLCKLSP